MLEASPFSLRCKIRRELLLIDSALTPSTCTSASSNDCKFGWSDIPCQGEYLVDSSQDLKEHYRPFPESNALSLLSLRNTALPNIEFTPNDKIPSKVRFASDLSIRTYEVVCAEAHSCGEGNLWSALGWAYNDDTVDFEYYDNNSQHRRSGELKTPSF